MNDSEHATHAADSRSMPDEVEVAVVGAGQVGLTMATMLTAYGIRTVVLDRAAGPAGHSRAAVVHARTLETLEPLGLVEEAVRGGVIVPHFGVRDRDRRLLVVDFDGLPTTHPYTLMLPQDETERLLREALGRRGGSVLWGHEVTGIRPRYLRSPRHPDGPRGLFATGFQGVDPPRVKTPALVFCTEAIRHLLSFFYLGST